MVARRRRAGGGVAALGTLAGAWPVRLALAAGLGPTAVAGTASGQGFRPLHADDRVLVTSYLDIRAVAAGPGAVWIATPDLVAMLDPDRGVWHPPLVPRDGFPPPSRPTALAVDRFADRLWLGTEAGSVHVYVAGLERWEQRAELGAAVTRIVPAGLDGTYVLTDRGWVRLAEGSLFPEPVGPAALPRAVGVARGGRVAAEPALQAVRGTLGVDAAGRRWPLTAWAADDRAGVLWVGTAGGGLVRFDDRTLEREWLTAGPPSRGVGAVVVDGADVWFGGDGLGPRNGVARADTALGRWSIEESTDGAPAGFVTRILPAADAIWFAASDGLYRRARTGSGRAAWRVWTARDGLPTERATSLAPAAGDGAVWAGTLRGLVRIAADGRAEAGLLAGLAVHDVAARGDTLWVATEAGLRIVAPASAATPAVAAPDVPVELSAAVVALHAAPDRVIALTPRSVWILEDGRWTAAVRDAALDPLGGLLRVTVQNGDAVWVGGDRGLARLDLRTGVWQAVAAPDIVTDAPVRGLAAAGRVLWMALPSGALRLRLRP
jgi:ligand-binding sensor domain-containing protein